MNGTMIARSAPPPPVATIAHEPNPPCLVKCIGRIARESGDREQTPAYRCRWRRAFAEPNRHCYGPAMIETVIVAE